MMLVQTEFVFGVAMKTILLTLVLFSVSGCCGWFSSDAEINVEVLEATSEYPYRYEVTQTGSYCGGGHTGLGNIMPVFFNFPKSYKRTLTISAKHRGKLKLSIPMHQIAYRDRATPKFLSNDKNIMLEGNIFSLIGNSNETGVLSIGEKALGVNLKSGNPFITGRWVDKLGYFEIYSSVDMREHLEDGSSDPKVINQNINGRTATSIYLKSIRLDRGQSNSFFDLSDKLSIFSDEDRKVSIFEGKFSDLIQEGKLLSIYFDNDVMKSDLYGVIHSTLLGKEVFIDIGASQAGINGTYIFD